jgi:hypothetical protein
MSGGDENSVDLDSTAITPINIEKLVKLFKTHRRAMDVDGAFCKGVFLPIEGKDIPDALIVYHAYTTADLKRECSLELRYSKATIHKLGF